MEKAPSPRNQRPKPTWTTERVALLKSYWADGLSANQIACMMGEITRNAVLGKVHRLGLAGRATTHRLRPAPRPHQHATRTATRAFGGSVDLRKLPKAKPLPAALLPHVQPLMLSFVALDEAGKRHCHYPIGDPRKPGFGFCGHPREAGASKYCAAHEAVTRRAA